jgi:hypothetical protein
VDHAIRIGLDATIDAHATVQKARGIDDDEGDEPAPREREDFGS